MWLFALSGGVGGLALLVSVFLGIVVVALVARRAIAGREGPGPFGSRWPASNWAYAIFLIAFVAGAASGAVETHAFRYGAVFWVVTIGFLAYRHAASRPRTRPCPRCGAEVVVGVLDCASCGFDFRAIGRGGREPSVRRDAEPGPME